jgi:hypothetical protein
LTSRTLRDGEDVAKETRYFLSSLERQALSPAQWLFLIRSHWSVENACHWTFDAVFKEDDRPWIRSDPKGALVVALLRRVAYNILSLFRSVTLRSEHNRDAPWRELLSWVLDALVGARERDVVPLLDLQNPRAAAFL